MLHTERMLAFQLERPGVRDLDPDKKDFLFQNGFIERIGNSRLR